MKVENLVAIAVATANESPCAKSKRGCVVWDCVSGELISVGYNHTPRRFECDGSEECRRSCSAGCIHAEAAAIYAAMERVGKRDLSMLNMLHVKTVDGELVTIGGPSCVECSKLIVEMNLYSMSLIHRVGYQGDLNGHPGTDCRISIGGGMEMWSYTPELFHVMSMSAKGYWKYVR